MRIFTELLFLQGEGVELIPLESGAFSAKHIISYNLEILPAQKGYFILQAAEIIEYKNSLQRIIQVYIFIFIKYLLRGRCLPKHLPEIRCFLQ